jgi:hypothetical protein
MRRFLPTGVLLLACGCAGGGALDQATLAGECEGDIGCVDELTAGPIAVGGTVPITVRVDTSGTGTAVLNLIPADPTVLQVDGHELTGLTPGMTAVLIIDETSGSVIDFFHLFVAKPERLEIARLGGVGAGEDLDGLLELLEGEQVTIGAIAYRGPQRLVGNDTLDWSVTGDAVTLLDDGNPDRQRVVARGAGDARITVESMGMSRSLDITVYP